MKIKINYAKWRSVWKIGSILSLLLFCNPSFFSVFSLPRFIFSLFSSLGWIFLPRTAVITPEASVVRRRESSVSGGFCRQPDPILDEQKRGQLRASEGIQTRDARAKLENIQKFDVSKKKEYLKITTRKTDLYCKQDFVKASFVLAWYRVRSNATLALLVDMASAMVECQFSVDWICQHHF